MCHQLFYKQAAKKIGLDIFKANKTNLQNGTKATAVQPQPYMDRRRLAAKIKALSLFRRALTRTPHQEYQRTPNHWQNTRRGNV